MVMVLVLASVGLGFMLGFIANMNQTRRRLAAEYGFNMHTAKLWQRATRIIRRLQAGAEFGIMDADPDVLSQETRTEVAQWVTDYRKAMTK